ncbi:DUF3320 domain-containing protein [Streptobacillus felis]|uniref:DUF3320 domain-containing protein n=1 Tax=Streptobacillus felis TaxID=1384509 RepID=A0A7Z0PEU4_9FUSO|nr:DUF3320 domain-containing protein [Streptobacillus felis]NYV27734.1 DUF3320 domain-containing protein [Streptobacillus felis]
MLKINKEMMTNVNYLLYHNYVPIIHRLEIENTGDEKLEDLSFKLYSKTEFMDVFALKIGQLDPKESLEIDNVNIRLNSDYLSNITENAIAEMIFEVYKVDEKIYEEVVDIDLSPSDYWLGIYVMPETIASFSTPNHPLISEIVVKASKYLRKWGFDSAFTGYLTGNMNTVKAQMAAIYAALQEYNLIYNLPPKDYEVLGQRIRTSQVVLEQKQGTCLDLSMLYSSCLEAVGLNPILIIIKGHAFIGCWLEESSFSDIITDDFSAIEKRIVEGLEEILLVECTDFVAEKGIDFDKSIKHGKDNMIDLSNFIMAIDIVRAKSGGFRAIPSKIDGKFVIERKVNTEVTSKPKELIEKHIGIAEDVKIDKQRLWERKLLDFSLRNSLLNFRITKNALRIMSHDLSLVEDRLVQGKDLSILEAPKEWNVGLRNSKSFEIETGLDLIKAISESEFKSNRLRTYLNEEDLENSIKTVYRSSKLSLEENGSNTLFLALGFLRWFENDVSEIARYAPLVLLPIEIVRSNKNKGYVIRSRQEETQINITLLEYLRQMHDIKIGGLDPLPEDEHGVDMPLVFNTIRQAVLNKKRWNVIDDLSFIGLFSFGQFVMWNDIRNRGDEIKENKIVSSLIKGYRDFENKNNEITIEDLPVPLNADSSQLRAIKRAINGESFVLHGAPGTGKSQTITNMIATALYEGKSVLFVAEKMAALNVVENRLDKVGLGPFCLELHSNKTNKTTVLKQLENVLEVSRYKSPEEFEKVTNEIKWTKDKLKYIVDELHLKRKSGLSIYEKIEKITKNSDLKEKVKVENYDITKEELEKNVDIINNIVINMKELGVYKEHSLKNVGLSEYNMETKSNFENDISEILEYRTESIAASNNIGISSYKDIESIYSIYTKISDNSIILDDLILSNKFDFNVSQMEELISKIERYNVIKNSLFNEFESSILDVDIKNIYLEWKKTEQSWFLSKMLKQNSLIKEISIHSKVKIDKNNMVEKLEKLKELMNSKTEILETNTNIKSYCENIYNEEKTDVTVLEKALQDTISLREEAKNYYGDINEEVLKEMYNLKANYIDFENLEKFLSKCSSIKEKYEVSLSGKLNDVFEELNNMFRNSDKLKDMILYNQKKNNLKEYDLESIKEAYENNEVSIVEILDAYLTNIVYRSTLKEIDENTMLKEFKGLEFEEIIKKYDELIIRYQELTMQEVVAKLSNNIPNSDVSNVSSSEMGILKRAIKSNGRMISIRQLFNQIPNLLRRLCPCMLMSPMSIAQYIDPKFPKFDLVIFDEASQIPTYSAIGAMARGENVIIVGDPKQMPPTSFFKSNKVDEDNLEIEDLESLLDDCLSITLPEEHLKWHYRSKHESLISFSNRMYYDNRLLTFPSPDDLVSNVKFIKIDGFYDKGKSKQNKEEARAVVEEIVRRLKDEKLRKYSIGVVTFNMVQQELIDDMLTERLYKDAELEEIYSNLPEPVFIKNLENVQGDERDVIMFSVGYGADKEGKVSMNFGPLNRDGGWRRLNVAISRSRTEMLIFSSLTPDQIDLNRTKSEGVKGLKMFLEFAMKGKNILAVKDTSNISKDLLIEKISNELSERGYKNKINLGSSEYKIDLGIIDPNNQEKYLLGILFDGYSCVNSETVRDRFILQPTILKLLGWSVYNVWSLDYIENPDKILNEIIDKVEYIIENGKEEHNLLNAKKAKDLKMEVSNETIITKKIAYTPYEVCHLGTNTEFYNIESQIAIKENILKIVEMESPISKKNLVKKVLACWHIARNGSQVEQIIDLQIRKLNFKVTKESMNDFIWSTNSEIKELENYRVEDVNGNKRNIEDISIYEIMPALKEVIIEQIAIEKKDLIREVAKKFGFTRIGTSIDKVISNVIDYCFDNGEIKLEEGKYLMNY